MIEAFELVWVALVIYSLYGAIRVTYWHFSEWRSWKTAVRDEINYLCEDYKDAP